MEVGNTIKAATMKSLLLLSYKNSQLVFCGQCFSIFSGDKQPMIFGSYTKIHLHVSFNI